MGVRRKPDPLRLVHFQEKLIAMADSDNPLHGAELATQILQQIDRLEQTVIGSYQQRFDEARMSVNALAEHLYAEDMLLHFDDRAQSNAASMLGVVNKLVKWVNSNYIDAQNKLDDIKEA